MKKILVIFLILSLLSSLVTTGFAASSADVTLTHTLTCNGQRVYTANPGDEIKVVLTLTSSDGNAFDIKNIQSEVAYDTAFFEQAEVTDVQIATQSQQSGWNTNENSHYEYRVFSVHAMFPNTPEGLLHCENEQIIAEYTLKVKDTAQIGDSGYVKSLIGRDVSVYGPDLEAYGEVAEDLTVVIGTPQTIYTIRYMNNGQQFSSADVTDTTTIINGPAPAGGLVFLGWEDENGRLWQPGETYTPTANTVFTAKWSTPIPNYTLTFHSNGGSSVAPVTRPAGSSIDLSGYVPTWNGYIFSGWYSDATLTTPVANITLNANTDVYAGWQLASSQNSSTNRVNPTKYTLYFETLGGTKLEALQKPIGAIIDLKDYIPEKEGFVFAGWYLDEDLTDKAIAVKMTNNITVYAKWEVKEAPGSNTPDIFASEHYAYLLGREDGYIYPQANLTRAEATTIFFRLINEKVRENSLTKTNRFDDVSADAWYNTAVSTLANLGILEGRDETHFMPDELVTRSELTTMVVRLSEATYNGADLFDDVSAHWARDYINTAASIGWVVGDGDLFRPDDSITRAEVAVLVNRVLNRLPETKEDLLPDMKVWADNPENEWYYLAICEATNSHDYELKEDGVHEKWVSFTATPDWTLFE